LNQNFPTKNLMGKRPWTTPEQQAWLEVLISAFIQAQQDKATGAFFENTYNEWNEKWPTTEPTEEEIRENEESPERALARKHKATVDVSVY
jgi:hypothetical protein